VNNYGFEVERRQRASKEYGVGSMEKEWKSVSFVKGVWSSNAPREYSYVDNGLAPGLYSYRIKQIDRSGSFKYSREVQLEVGSAPRTLSLSQNYPNPFNPTTTIEFTLANDGHVSLKVYDIVGREVATLVDRDMKTGIYQQVVFDASRLSSGVYFAVLRSGGNRSLRKMILLK
jgi:hypothetical protein